MVRTVTPAVAVLAVAGVVAVVIPPAQAAVSKEQARQTWGISKFKAFPFEQGIVTEDITGAGRLDAVQGHREGWGLLRCRGALVLC